MGVNEARQALDDALQAAAAAAQQLSAMDNEIETVEIGKQQLIVSTTTASNWLHPVMCTVF